MPTTQQLNALIFSTKPLKEMYPALVAGGDYPLVGLEEWGKKLDSLVKKTIHVGHLCDLQEVTMAKLADEDVTPHTMGLLLEWVEHNLMHYGLMQPAECAVAAPEVEAPPTFLREAAECQSGEEWLAMRPGGWNERDRVILERRVLERDGQKRPTGVALANQYNCERANISLIEKKIGIFLQEIAGDSGIPSCRRMTQEIRLVLGAGLPLAEAEEKLHQIAPHDPVAVACAAYAAGQYEVKRSNAGWLLRDGVEFPEVGDFLEEDRWRIAEERLDARLVELGFLPAAIEAWKASHPKLRQINGQLAFIGSTAADRTVAILSAYRVRMDTEQLLVEYEALMGESSPNPNSYSQALAKDSRMMLVAKNKWALDIWGGDRYEGISESISLVLNENGGTCTREKLEEECQRRWEILPSSIRSNMATDLFSLDNGIVRFCQEDVDFQGCGDISKRKSLFLWEDRSLSWCHRISKHDLRGSGQPIPKELAGWLQLRPEMPVKVVSPSGELRFSRNPGSINGATVSTILALCKGVGAAEGDWSVFKFMRSERGLEFTFSLCGDDIASNFGLPADMSKEEIRRQLAAALKVNPGEELQALRARGEGDLAELF